MDDTQTTQLTTDPVVQQPQPQADMPMAQDSNPTADSMSSMNDVAGMTPPPAPVMPVGEATMATPTPASNPMAADPSGAPAKDEDDYSYAEDVLNEILDALDRIETKLDAMEKKQG